MLVFELINYKRFEVCKTLDKIGYANCTDWNVKPYVINDKVTASYDCKKAREYYEKELNRSLVGYDMHHTLDRRIVPVAHSIHKISHFGGCKLHGLRRK